MNIHIHARITYRNTNNNKDGDKRFIILLEE